MLYGAVALLGVAAWRNMPIELLPDTQLPRLKVTGTWRGASPETVEAFLTSPLESAIQQVQGVEKVTSNSYEQNGIGTADIDIEFSRETDMDFARLDLSERIAALEEELPPGADRVAVQPVRPRGVPGAESALPALHVHGALHAGGAPPARGRRDRPRGRAGGRGGGGAGLRRAQAPAGDRARRPEDRRPRPRRRPRCAAGSASWTWCRRWVRCATEAVRAPSRS